MRFNFKKILFGLIIILSSLVIFFALDKCINTMKSKKNIDAIVKLTSVEPESIPTIIDAGDNHILLSWPLNKETKTNIQLVDIKKDTIKQEIQLDGYWELKNIRFTDGSFLLFDADNGQFCFLSQDLKKSESFTPENTLGVFSHNRKNYYFIKNRILYCTEMESKKNVKVSTTYDLRFVNIVGIHPTKNQIALNYIISPYSSKSGTAIWDFDSNKLIMLHKDIFQVDFRDDSICFMQFSDEDMAYSFIYGNEEKGFHYASANLFSNAKGLNSIYGSDYLLGSRDNMGILYYLGEEVATYSLADSGITSVFNSTCFIPEDELIVGAVFENDVSKLYVVNPSKLPFSNVARSQKVSSPLMVNPELSGAYWGALSDDVILNDMSEVKVFANSLEKKYGIQILLSNQCSEVCSSCEYDILTTNQMNYSDEPKKIAHFLNALDQALALYPEGFFTQFRNSSGKGGIRFMPIGQIKSNADIVGVCYQRYEWNNIAVDVDIEDLISIICHEIWHATENKILSSNYNEFAIEKWNSLNPPNFKYYEDTHLLDPNQHKWTLFSAGSEGVYFTDNYARLDAIEDRAKIMEYIMTKDDFTDMMMKSPAINKKYKLMCEAVRKSFDTTEWSNVRWERFLEKKQ